VVAVKVVLNGTEREIAVGATLAALLDEIDAPLSAIAVARNDEIVRRSDLHAVVVRDGDRIEIIKAVAGG
jgi:thiamine biosynthesis protein ThiS